MPLPEIRLTFDTDNLSTFIKDLLNLEERVEYVIKRFDSTIIFKLNGDAKLVRKEALRWLESITVNEESPRVQTEEEVKITGSSKEPEKAGIDAVKDFINSSKKEGANNVS